MRLTYEMIQAGRSKAGGFRLVQLKVLGLELPARGWPKTGWIQRLIGREVSQDSYSEFLDLGSTTAKERSIALHEASEAQQPTFL